MDTCSGPCPFEVSDSVGERSKFVELMQRVRAGDQQAASDVVQRYEKALRRAVRFRMTDSRLDAVLDSVDICQSVLASFFMRATAGQYDLTQPEDLQKLLVAMARKKLAAQARKHYAQKRDQRRISGPVDQAELAGAQRTPSQQVALEELLQAVQDRLSDEEKQIVDLRNEGLEWQAVADHMKSSPEAVRKKLARALDRIGQELDIEEPDGG